MINARQSIPYSIIGSQGNIFSYLNKEKSDNSEPELKEPVGPQPCSSVDTVALSHPSEVMNPAQVDTYSRLP